LPTRASKTAWSGLEPRVCATVCMNRPSKDRGVEPSRAVTLRCGHRCWH
jgi:hypothetical protein